MFSPEIVEKRFNDDVIDNWILDEQLWFIDESGFNFNTALSEPGFQKEDRTPNKSGPTERRTRLC